MSKNILIENPELIKEVQQVQLEILKEFDRICRQNNLTYHAYGGTLIGAVRHQGFIPWDDDLDVAMLREDYDKFIELSKNELSNKYFIQTIETDPKAYCLFAKIRKNNTLFIEESVKNFDIHQGIFIDIFPFDNVKNEKYTLENKIQYFFHKVETFLIKDKLRFSNKMMTHIRSIIDLIITDKLKYKFRQKLNKKFQKYNKTETEFVSDVTYGSTEDHFYKTLMKRQDFSDTMLLPFEDIEIMVPKKYDYYLTQKYGNYMNLPPKEQQLPHHGIIELKL